MRDLYHLVPVFPAMYGNKPIQSDPLFWVILKSHVEIGIIEEQYRSQETERYKAVVWWHY